MAPAETRIVFLCYSRRDRGIVRKCQVIIRAAGMMPWRDEESIPPGSKWRLSIGNAIDSCERVLVFWCRHALASDEVRNEYWAGIRAGKDIAPIRLDGTTLPDPLKAYQATEMPGWNTLTHALMTVERGLWVCAAVVLLAALVAYAAS
jgi:TIR domain